MLNDAAKERERVMEVAAEADNLEHLVGDVEENLGMHLGDPAKAGHVG